MAAKHLTLEVHQSLEADVFKDTVRIAETDRQGLNAGRVHRFRANSQTFYAIIRGLEADKPLTIRIDQAARSRLGLHIGQSCTFAITQSGFWGQLRWAWNATDPAYAVAARLGVLSFWLGLLSLALTVKDDLLSLCARGASALGYMLSNFQAG